MSLALYRRYRPETFEEVIGQEHVTGPLQQALRNQRVNHAYLFSGPRGCGKTTSARILARCLNCEQGPTPTPCGQCKSCVGLARGAAGSIDVIEIDAASHGGVDDARDLRERAFFAPVESRYKIYILDEAHMVSPAGFNALLKVVEEPPPHLKFIFATTEPEKVIGTIRSRTHHYPFRLVPPGTLREYLAHLCEQEGIKVETEVLPLVVRAGAGSVRDSLSVLDQLLAGADENGVSYQAAAALLGYTDAALLDEAVGALAARSGAVAFEIVDRVVEGGHDPRRFLGDLLERLRDLVILNAVPDAAAKGLLSAPPDRLARMSEQAASFGQAELSRAADLANTGLTEMRGATAPRLLLELVFARILLPGGEDAARSLAARLERLERFGPPAGAALQTQQSGGAVAEAAQAPPQNSVSVLGYVEPGAAPQPQPQSEAHPQPQQVRQAQPPTGPTLPPAPWRNAAPAVPAPSAQQPSPQQSAPQQSQSPAAASPGDVAAIRGRWADILDGIRAHSRVTWTMVSSDNAHVVGVEGRTLQLGFNIPSLRESFRGSKHEDLLRQVLGQVFGGDWRVEVIVDPSAGHGGGSSAPSQGPYSPPSSPFSSPSPSPAAAQDGGWSGPAQTTPASPPPVEQAVPPVTPPQATAVASPLGMPVQNAPSMQNAQSVQNAQNMQSAQVAPPAGGGAAPMAGGLGPMPGHPAAEPAFGQAKATSPSATVPAAAPPTVPPHPPAVPTQSPAPSQPGRPGQASPGIPPPEDEDFDPHVAAYDDEAAPDEPGLSARDLLIKELGASILEESQNPD
ncbi:MAG TPA: DNA polymerase III subunit gamma and tau [Actinospica sp.]|nr:DNA polymerase III subunit gamma and tau [Actinospica sp.]